MERSSCDGGEREVGCCDGVAMIFEPMARLCGIFSFGSKRAH